MGYRSSRTPSYFSRFPNVSEVEANHEGVKVMKLDVYPMYVTLIRPVFHTEAKYSTRKLNTQL